MSSDGLGKGKKRLFGRNLTAEIFSAEFIFYSYLKFLNMFYFTKCIALYGRVNSWKNFKIEIKVNDSKIMTTTYVVIFWVTSANKMFLVCFSGMVL